MSRIALLTALIATAVAGDDDLGDFDLGGSMAEADISYNGQISHRSEDKVAATVPITVSAPVGTLAVYCTDNEYVEATTTYAFTGSDPAALEAYGRSFKVSTAGGSVGSAKLSSGTRAGSVKTATISTVVNVPKSAKLTITTGSDWLKVSGCAGSVTATVAKNGAYVGGPMTAFNLTVNAGDVTVEVTGDGKLGANSAISAPKGAVTLTMPIVQDLKVDVRGANVNVAHSVVGTMSATQVTGTLGTPGPTLTVKASGDVAVKTTSGSGF